MNSRRDFLKTSTLLGFGATVPTFLGKTALAASSSTKETILVVIQLTGGNDGLNTVVPFADPMYAKLRPTIGIKKDALLKIDDSLGLHPSMEGFSKLFDDSALSIVQGVGYPNPSQSHFRSMDVWNAGRTEEHLTEGWLGTALKQKTLPGFHLARDGNDTAPLALTGAPQRVPSITTLNEFQLQTAGTNATDKGKQKKLIEAVSEGAMPSTQPNMLDFVRRTATNTYSSSKRLQEVGKSYTPKVPYPATSLGNRLKLAAQLIDAGTGARIFYASVDGFDTHAGQGGADGGHANLLREVAGAITAFVQDLTKRGQGDRVCVMTFSEFGRRAKENGSFGTDHGSGAPMFLAGAKVKAGAIGKHPSLTDLDDGNLKHAIDFRCVYAAMLKDWLGLDPVPVLGKGFTPLKVFS